MSSRKTAGLALAVAAALAGAAPAAHADTLITAAPGAKNLAAAGGYAAWAARRPDGRWQLQIRNPDGSLANAAIHTFGGAPDPSLGSDDFAVSRHIVAVYSRCSGTSTVKGCDVYRYDLVTKKESKVSKAATTSYSEVAPSIASGRIGFVRRDGTNNGVYVYVPSYADKSSHLSRVDGHISRETAISQSRIAFLYRNSKGKDDITLGQLDGGNRRLMVRRDPGVLFSTVITRYRVGWLEHRSASVVAKMTNRINPSDTEPTIQSGRRALPASTNSAAADDTYIFSYLDADGYKRISPPIFPGTT